MAELTKPLFTILFVNLLLVAGGFTVFNNGVIGDFVDFGGETGTELVGASQTLNESVPKGESFVQDPSGTSLSLLDGLATVLDILRLFGNILLAPIALLIELPNVARIFVGAPLTILMVIAYASFIRSGA